MIKGIVLISLILFMMIISLYRNSIPSEKIILYKDIYPVFKKRCSMCHNETTPNMNWLDYNIAFKSKETIKLKLLGKEMPPIGYIILDSERQDIIYWVNGGGK